MELRYGTRFELVLQQSEGTARAVYRAVVRRPGSPSGQQAMVEITPAGARIVSGGENLEPALASQLLAIARTIGKRAEETSWPRRIHRWRQPGVR